MMEGSTQPRAYPPYPPTNEPQRAMTELEAHGGNLADTSRRMHALADKLQGRVDGFMQSPANLSVGAGSASDKPAPAPQPGTLGCIRYYHAEIDRAAERIDIALNQLAGIL